MKALIKTKKGYGNVKLTDIKEPKCGTDEIKIKITDAGICGTDLHILEGSFPYYNTPVILGHEFTGKIIEIGKYVKNEKNLCMNDEVVILPSAYVTCGVCEYCRNGFFMCCPQRKGMGHGVDGGMVEYKCVREDFVYKLPDRVSPKVGVLAEPLACCIHAVDYFANITPDYNCMISGPGIMGLLILSLLKLRNCRVALIGLARDAKRFKVAREIGLDLEILADKENIREKMYKVLETSFFDIAYECAGVSESVDNCIASLKKMGYLIQLSFFKQKLAIDINEIVLKQLGVFGSLGYTWSDWNKSMKLLGRKELKLDILITDTYRLEKWEDAFKKAKSPDSLKVVFEF